MKIETEASLTAFIDNPPWLLHVLSDLLNSSRPEAFVEEFVWPGIGAVIVFAKLVPKLLVIEHDNRRSLPRSKPGSTPSCRRPDDWLMNHPGWHVEILISVVLREAGELLLTVRSRTGLDNRDAAGKGIASATFNTGISLLTIASRLHLDKPEVRELSRTAGD